LSTGDAGGGMTPFEQLAMISLYMATHSQHTVRLVLVEWLESRSPSSQWEQLSDLEKRNACECVSVGLLVADHKDEKIVAPTMAEMAHPKNLHTSAVITIPARAITKISRLEERYTL